ncbi:hypothetical protein ACFUYE_32925, partial [Micromonospora humida]
MIDVEVVARRFVADVWNAGREESADELVAEECPGLGGTGPAAGRVATGKRRTSTTRPSSRRASANRGCAAEMVASVTGAVA